MFYYPAAIVGRIFKENIKKQDVSRYDAGLHPALQGHAAALQNSLELSRILQKDDAGLKHCPISKMASSIK
ncbi:hypothetical protein [Desulfospira joergensenii]|uniref:hypothetical protein n=1 Tax=Desulfospira joergensenii TaxID=53329 RepID=UPI0003B40527|nr:hypothetical protein [Desulfospira joergensenii]